MEPDVILSPQLVEAASWWLVAELMRRYPTRLRLIETHPGGGQYDCLTLLERSHLGDEGTSPVGKLDLNRVGRAHVHSRFDGAPLGLTDDDAGPVSFQVWPALVAAEEPLQVVDDVAARAGLPAVAKLPPSTPEILTFRLIAAFLSHAVFGRQRWECRNGYLDPAGLGGGVRHHYLTPFAEARQEMEQRRTDDLYGIGAYRFWFLVGDAPQVCLSTDGVAWRPDGRRFELGEIYGAAGRRIWPVVTVVAGDVLP